MGMYGRRGQAGIAKVLEFVKESRNILELRKKGISDMEKEIGENGQEALKRQILMHMPDLLWRSGLISGGERIGMKRLIEQERPGAGRWKG